MQHPRSQHNTLTSQHSHGESTQTVSLAICTRKQRPRRGKNNRKIISQKAQIIITTVHSSLEGTHRHMSLRFTPIRHNICFEKTSTGYHKSSEEKRKIRPYTVFAYNQSRLVPDAQSSCIVIQRIYNIADAWLSTDGISSTKTQMLTVGALLLNGGKVC